jgi:hypothetical protein
VIKVELLHFDGCPSWEHAWAELGRALRSFGSPVLVQLSDVHSLAEGERHGFVGSPSFHIDRRDLEDYQGPPVLACRRYESSGGRGWPTEDLLRQQLGAAAGDAT